MAKNNSSSKVLLVLCWSACFLKAAANETLNNEPTNKAAAAAAGHLFGLGDEAAPLNKSDQLDLHIENILARDGPDMRPGRDYKDSQDISLSVAKRALQLLHERTRATILNQIDTSLPIFNELMAAANVSKTCEIAIGTLLSSAKNLDSWAVKILNSWGKFPMAGIFEGTYGDVGSFQTCVDVENIPIIDHAHYCSVTFRPVLPSIKEYEIILHKEPDEILNLFEEQRRAAQEKNANVSAELTPNPLFTNQSGIKSPKSTVRDAFSDVLQHAQYHHYVYYKLGTCWPIGCSPIDVRRLVRLVGKRNILMHGPVKCYSKNSSDYENLYDDDVDNVGSKGANRTKLVISIWDKNRGIFIWKPFFNKTQKVALAIIVSASAFILLMTLIDLLVNKSPDLLHKLRLSLAGSPLSDSPDVRGSSILTQQVEFALVPCNEHTTTSAALSAQLKTKRLEFSPEEDEEEGAASGERKRKVSLFMSVVDDCSIITNAKQFFRVSEGQMRNDILCLNGIRCLTMIWVILCHTMMYNDWSQWARTREVEKSLDSYLIQPLFNGTYLVDSFFLMSGLLSSFTAFKRSQGIRTKFNSLAFIVGRWLRLTPQIFFVSMIFIIFPAISYGPHWYPLVGEFSENCMSNWWINVLHIQAFYKKEEMCNFVTWWISIDFFYHLLATLLIWIILIVNHKTGFTSMMTLISACVLWQSIEHYKQAYPPNIMSTIPQTSAMWTKTTLEFFWTPMTHSVPFFFGFYIGYLMALKRKLITKHLNTRRALIGWTLSIGLLLVQLYSTYWWVTGKTGYSRLVSTLFYAAGSFVWAGSLCWIIIACQHGYGGFVNTFLSWKAFIILGKCSYLVYLAHFQILFLFFGNQNMLIEPTSVSFSYTVMGNIFLSTLQGIAMCIVFELPWLKAQRRLMKYVR